MGAGLIKVLLVCCAALMTALPARAEDQTFAELLARAKSQAAAGHRWAPPGDNMTETVMTMMDLIPAATAAQLAELSALLANDQSTPPTPARDQGTREAARPAAPLAQGRPSQDQPVRGSTSASEVAPSLATPNRTTVGQTAPGQTASDQTTTGQTAAERLADGRAASNQPAPKQASPNPAASNLTVPKQTSPDQAAPNQAAPVQPSPNEARHDQTPASTPMRTPAQVALGEVAPRGNVPPATPSDIFPKQSAPGLGKPEPGPRAAALFARGLEAEHQGDFSGARRFYAISAKLGEAAAARNLGRLFDPAYISRNALGGIDPDPALARQWYQRAIELGDPEAGPLLEAMSMR